MRPAVHVTLGEGRYRLQQRLGAGGMASVWLASDERLGRSVAIKIVADTLADDERWVTRFNREARAAAALSHRGVVHVFDYGVEDGRPYLVMEYVRGGTLAEPLAASRGSSGDGRRPDAQRSPIEPIQLARELLEAVGAVHAAGILHRDIKPANLLIDDHGHVRLTDFGIAQAQDSTGLTRTGMVIGTLRYLAPEVAAGHPATVQSDLYSAGVVIRQVAGEPPPPRLVALIDALVAEDPGDRPESARAALALLQQAAAEEPTGTAETRPVSQSRTARWPAATPETITQRLRTGATSPRRPFSATGGTAPASRRIARGPAYVMAALLVVVIIIVLVTSVGGSGSGSRPSSGGSAAPSPAPSTASVSGQVKAMDRIIESATRR
ncbi:MAG TPA: serine/threonine-protein kinase [Solirubrobacteraceae bacterium]|nr:serine/threonine-protein kinase [Solirubrobacteraceae bacterium]